MSITEELKPLFYPKSVAVIGASNNPGKVGNIILGVLKKTIKNLYPVHPKAEEILGLKVFNSIENLPDNISMAIITISAGQAVEAVRSCAKKGIKIV